VIPVRRSIVDLESWVQQAYLDAPSSAVLLASDPLISASPRLGGPSERKSALTSGLPVIREELEGTESQNFFRYADI
jgi:hypothetical protein